MKAFRHFHLGAFKSVLSDVTIAAGAGSFGFQVASSPQVYQPEYVINSADLTSANYKFRYTPYG
jgi:hypothetical protein